MRVFADGDYVFAHTEYDFSTSRIGFEVFRFEGDRTVEHWDNIQPRKGPNPSGHSMVDGPTKVTALEQSEFKRDRVRTFICDVLIPNRLDQLGNYLDEHYIEHNPRLGDGLATLHAALSEPAANGGVTIRYDRLHRVLAEGNFVLAVSEGLLNGQPAAFYRSLPRC